jgi:hypothetical protein
MRENQKSLQGRLEMQTVAIMCRFRGKCDSFDLKAKSKLCLSGGGPFCNEYRDQENKEARARGERAIWVI